MDYAQKIRRGLKDRDSKYKLSAVIGEIDDAFFGSTKEGGDKWGRGSSWISVIIEVSTNGEGIGYAKTTVVYYVGNTVKEIAKANVKEGQIGWVCELPCCARRMSRISERDC